MLLCVDSVLLVIDRVLLDVDSATFKVDSVPLDVESVLLDFKVDIDVALVDKMLLVVKFRLVTDAVTIRTAFADTMVCK